MSSANWLQLAAIAALVLAGALSALAVISYMRLADDAGDEISGHKRSGKAALEPDGIRLNQPDR